MLCAGKAGCHGSESSPVSGFSCCHLGLWVFLSPGCGRGSWLSPSLERDPMPAAGAAPHVPQLSSPGWDRPCLPTVPCCPQISSTGGCRAPTLSRESRPTGAGRKKEVFFEIRKLYLRISCEKHLRAPEEFQINTFHSGGQHSIRICFTSNSAAAKPHGNHRNTSGSQLKADKPNRPG